MVNYLSKMSSRISLVVFCCASIAAAQSYEANWDSLEKHKCPEWFRDAKFGIYAHWGVYSTSMATGNTDWYSRHMYVQGHRNRVEHEDRFGPVAEFGYKDLIPRFTAENFHAEEWADLFAKSGARFGGVVGEHADGFSMWDSRVNPWNAARMGPKRDVVAEMERAIRKRGLKFLVSMHHQWRWGWYPTWDPGCDACDPAYASLYGPRYPRTAQGMPTKGKGKGVDTKAAYPMPSEEFQQEWLNKVKEVVSQYSPDVLWFDNRMQLLSESIRAEMVCFYYNHSTARSLESVLTFKRPDLPLGTATVDLERARMQDIYPEPWLADTSIAVNSWAYSTDLKYYSADRIIDDLVDIVSKNGCMLLNIAPHPDGTVPSEQKHRLLEIGEWLERNGEAIYGSRPWLIYGEGPTVTPGGHLADVGFDGFTNEDIRFTTKGKTLYAICLGWPEGGQLTIRTLSNSRYSGEFRSISLLGSDEEIQWRRTPEGLVIDLPDNPSTAHAHAFKLVRE